jgi:hypothetical protein
MFFDTSHFPSQTAPRRPSRGVSACLALILIAIGAAWCKPPAKGGASPKPKASPAAEPAAAATPRLDSARVHRLYLDGEFDAAIAILEDNLKETRQYRHEDSVFIFKHLGVMYAAQYETREKGKYYMHKLLSVEPTVRIMDMYASDMIYMIFKNIQEEFESNRTLLTESRHENARQNARSDSMAARQAKPEPVETRQRPERAGEAKTNNGKTWLWTGAAVAAVAVGVGSYYLISADPQKTVKEREVSF